MGSWLDTAAHSPALQSTRIVEVSCDAKVAEPHDPLRGEEDVCWLDIPMQDSVAMAVLKCKGDLNEDV